MNVTQLESTARALVSSGRGILAADESDPTIEKRFAALGIENTEENRRVYREMLFTTTGVAEFISGVILFDETIRQTGRRRHATRRSSRQAQGSSRASRSTRAPRPLAGSRQRVDHRGPGRPPRAPDRVPRCSAPASPSGARVITIGPRYPDAVLHRRQRPRARALRRALPGGGARPDRRARGADGRRPHASSAATRSPRPRCTRVFAALDEPARLARGHAAQAEHGPLRQELPAAGAASQEVAEATLRCLRRTVPAAVPGIVFLSGGQSDELADRAPERDERAWRAAPVAALVLVRPRAAGGRPRRRGRGTRAASRPARRRFTTAPGSTASPAPAGMRRRWNRSSHSPTDEDAGDPRRWWSSPGHQRGHLGSHHRGAQPWCARTRLLRRLQVAGPGRHRAHRRAGDQRHLPHPLRRRLHHSHVPHEPHPDAGGARQGGRGPQAPRRRPPGHDRRRRHGLRAPRGWPRRWRG